MAPEVLEVAGERGEAEGEGGEAKGTEETKMVAVVKEGGKAMPKKETWYIRLHKSYVAIDGETFRAVEGYGVTVPGYEEFDFFVHGQTGDWSLNDARSGCLVVEDWPTIKQVTAAAKRRLDFESGSREKYREAVERSVEKNGLSPRYDEDEAQDREEVKL